MSHPGLAMQKKEDIAALLSKLYNVDQKLVVLFGFKAAFGGGRSSGFGLIYDSEEDLKKVCTFFPTSPCLVPILTSLLSYSSSSPDTVSSRSVWPPRRPALVSNGRTKSAEPALSSVLAVATKFVLPRRPPPAKPCSIVSATNSLLLLAIQYYSVILRELASQVLLLLVFGASYDA